MGENGFLGDFKLVRTKEELKFMSQSGKITAKALKKAIQSVKAGLSLIELDKIAEEEVLRLGGGASFKTVPGYFWASCLTVNDEIVHGTPRDIRLKRGDILKIDLGAVFKGWHTDAAWTVIVGDEKDPEKVRFLQVGEKALREGITKAVAGNRIGDISSAIQKVVEGAGYSIVKSLSGHGVGRAAHEEPEVPGFGKPGTGPKLLPGMTLAIEVIYARGRGEVYEKEDGWTVALADKSWGGLFEMTVIVKDKRAEVITDWRKA